MRKIMGVMLCIPFLWWAGARIYCDINFGIDCEGHLKRAADANTIELAKQELAVSLNYLERNGITSGYTSVLYNTPDEDVGFWHKNLNASLGELESVKPDATQLERSNLLLKLRETLLDHGSNGEHVTAPDGISIFPNNVGYAWWCAIGLVLGIIGAYLIMIDDGY
jgi:hypothetical protein